MLMFPNLTGEIRNDKAGMGHYGAPRGSKRGHDGVDYVIKPGAEVLSPATGKISRIAMPYVADKYTGVEIVCKSAVLVLFYVRPMVEVDGRILFDQACVGAIVKQAQPIGIAQDITARYPGLGMIPHIHLRVTSIDPERLMPRRP